MNTFEKIGQNGIKKREETRRDKRSESKEQDTNSVTEVATLLLVPELEGIQALSTDVWQAGPIANLTVIYVR